MTISVERMALIFLGIIFAMVFMLSASPVSAQSSKADIQKSTCQGSELKFTTEQVNNPTADCQYAGDTKKPADKVNDLIAQIINIFSIVVGVVAVIMIIVGGFRYITSGGDSGKITSAKNTILYAIIGLIIVALAQFIVKFVLSKVTGTT